MKYFRPVLRAFGSTSGALQCCTNGSMPGLDCLSGAGNNTAGGCNAGCGANNRCNLGYDAGLTSGQQGCISGNSALPNCSAGSGVGIHGFCATGHTAHSVCSTGSHPD